jgi:agmatinase
MKEKMIAEGLAIPQNFAGLPPDFSRWEDSHVVVLPVPYDLTTSYQSGGRFGPQAILEASLQVELYDDELQTEPYEIGIHTLPPLEPTVAGPEVMSGKIQGVVEDLLEAKKFPIIIGGDHSITIGVLKAFAKHYKKFSVLQLDAHADLRDSYHGTTYSHACVARRATEIAASLTQIGIRNYSAEEAGFLESSQVKMIPARDLQSSLEPALKAIDSIKNPLYLTLDVDVFDSSIMPATGTPEPGGLNWYAVIALLRRAFEKHQIIGCDVVELAPIGGMKAPDFLVAKLIYKIVGYLYKAKS